MLYIVNQHVMLSCNINSLLIQTFS